MADIVNLRQARKRKARKEKERAAAANRLAHGRTKPESARTSLLLGIDEKRLKAHRRETTEDEAEGN